VLLRDKVESKTDRMRAYTRRRRRTSQFLLIKATR